MIVENRQDYLPNSLEFFSVITELIPLNPNNINLIFDILLTIYKQSFNHSFKNIPVWQTEKVLNSILLMGEKDVE